MRKKYKIYVWDIGDDNVDFNGFNYILYWQGNSSLLMMYKFFKAKRKKYNKIKIEC